MLVALPVASWVALVIIFRRRGVGWRLSMLLAAAAWGAVVAGLTELLSALDAIAFNHVVEGWLVVTWGCLAGIYFARPRRALPRTDGGWSLRELSWPNRALLALLCLELGALAVIAVVAAPNNLDGLTYHMSRIVHWMQNGNVRPYPTHVLRQLHANPFAEFVILHLQVLCGSDRFANMVQWTAFAGGAVAATLAAKRLGAAAGGQLASAVFCGTLTIGILQATNVQNDAVVGFWLVTFAALSLSLMDGVMAGRAEWLLAAAAGAALGLGILTKATTYVFALPLGLWLAIALVRRSGWAGAWRAAGLVAVVLAVAAALNLGHWSRNQRLYGRPLGPMAEDPETGNTKYANDVFTPAALVSNAVRCAGMELFTPWEKWDRAIGAGVGAVHRWLHVPQDDPRTTWTGTNFAMSVEWGPKWNNEDLAADPLHFLLLAACGAVAVTGRFGPRARAYACVVGAGFLLFGGYLRWQPWHCRLLLPLMMAWSPVVGVALVGPGSGTGGVAGRVAGRVAAWAGVAAGVAMLSVGAAYVLKNNARPVSQPGNVFLVDREEQYFYQIEGVRDAYSVAGGRVARRQCNQVGWIAADEPEYPMWVLLSRRVPGFRMECVVVKNLSRSTAAAQGLENWVPCMILTMDARSHSMRVDVVIQK